MFYGFSPLQVTAVRTVIGAVFMTVLLLIRSPQLLKIRLRDIWMFIGTGIISVVLFNLFYLITFSLSSLSVAVMLLYTAPVFVMLLSVLLFKERLTKGKLLALASTVTGCLFFVRHYYRQLAMFSGSVYNRYSFRIWLCAVQHFQQIRTCTVRFGNHFCMDVFIWRRCRCYLSASPMKC